MEFRHERVVLNDDLPFKVFEFEGREGKYKVSKHWHQSIEIFFVLEGKINFFINSELHSLEAGHFIIVNSNEIHSIDCPTPNFTIVLQIPRNLFEAYNIEDILFKATIEENDKRLVTLMKNLYFAYKAKEYGYIFHVLSQFYEILHLLILEYREVELDEERIKQKKNLEKLSKITRYIKDNYKEDLSLISVAGTFGFSPTYLSRIFQKYASINYRSYVLNIRLDAAYKQLVNTDDSISEISINCGFPDSRSFSKAFQKRFSILPSQYRREIKKRQESAIN
ncbi:MAG: helix-turn-helix domain-containing protein [Velocimicrobium sp.]